jgi:asparagine synthase (glutamine-hydrolysing)
MCGLTGLLDTSGTSEAKLRATVQTMTDSLHHRGPDSGAIWAEGGIALGHRRLAIIDLSEAGAQPMLSATGRFALVFNGEIYNHLDLRSELQQAGAAPAWRGHSDTETLLAAIEHWGLDAALQRTAGMFALALWDRRERRLMLARDRMGEKPLYWGWSGRALVFGSELKALRRHPAFDRAVCPEAVAVFLRLSHIPAPRSIHPGLYKLEPGCILDLSGDLPPRPPTTPLRPGQHHGGLSIRRWFDLNAMVDASRADPFTTEAEALDALETTLSAAVRRQMISDVPLGALLSGGIDSSLIVALMQKTSTQPVHSFSIGFEDPAFDESRHAAAVARHLGTRHSEMIVTDADAREVIPALPQMYDEPFADSSQMPTHLVCRMARREVTVVLTGDAGDELFGGYDRYLWGPRIWNRFAVLPAPVRIALGRAIDGIPVKAWDRLGHLAAPFLQVARPGDKAHKLAARLREVRGLDDLYLSLISEWPGHRIARGLAAPPATVMDDPLPSSLSDDPAGRMMVQDMRCYLPDDILCKVDRASMAVGLETRVPFLDPEVVALSARLPAAMKLRDGKGKWALRQVLFRHVPQDLIERPKTGFGIPVGDWLRGPLRPWAEDLLSPASLGRDGLLDPVPIRQAWAEHLSGTRDWTFRLWIVLMLMSWLDALMDREI